MCPTGEQGLLLEQSKQATAATMPGKPVCPDEGHAEEALGKATTNGSVTHPG